MQLDGFFEDLEARFDSELAAATRGSAVERANLIRVLWAAEGFTDLVACLVGRDFVGGMALGRNDWQLIRQAAVAQIHFRELVNIPLPATRFLDFSVTDFLNRLPLPLAVTLVSLEDHGMAACILVELRGEMLITQTAGVEDMVGVPLASLSRIHIDSVENLGGFE